MKLRRLTVSVWVPEKCTEIEQFQTVEKRIMQAAMDMKAAYTLLTIGCGADHDFGPAEPKDAATCAKPSCLAYKPMGLDWAALRQIWIDAEERVH